MVRGNKQERYLQEWIQKDPIPIAFFFQACRGRINSSLIQMASLFLYYYNGYSLPSKKLIYN